jgi:energy-coupling factor transporter ATP-binding protein EcfA2
MYKYSFNSDDTLYLFSQSRILEYLNTNNIEISSTLAFERVRLGKDFKQAKIAKYLEFFEFSNADLICQDYKGISEKEDNDNDYIALFYTYHTTNKTTADTILKFETFPTSLRVKVMFSKSVNEAGKLKVVTKLKTFFSILHKQFPTIPEDEQKVAIQFTFYDGDSVQTESREIYCPTYQNIRNNYPTIAPHLDYIINLERPDDIGKFIFWYGPPGTGKSYMIRALSQAYKHKANISYVIDPEQFFHNAFYMQQVITSTDPCIYSFEDSENEELEISTPIKLFIIEDGLNYIMMDSAHKEGGAISRLLNVTDGMLGEGLRLLFLVTSNEKVENIDPAFLRIGRCLQSLEFPYLNKDEAQTWIVQHTNQNENIELPKKCPYSLAELYAAINEYRNPIAYKSTNTVGFTNNRR